MPKGYFFIITPFQYLSALEARNHFKKELNKVFLFVLHTKLSSRQLHSIIDENLWDNVIYTKDLKVNWPIKFINLLFKILQIFKRRYYLLHNIGKIKKNDYLFIGNLNVQWLRWIVWKGKMEKIIILDDGFSILNALSYINNSKHKLTSKDNLLIWLEEIVFPTKKLELNKVILFSIFNKIDTTSAKIIYNNLSYIKEKFGHKNYENYEIVYFIGQPFVALNLIPKIKYISIINCIKTFYENKGIEFKYCIHRTENILDYPSSWDILSFDYPIEVQLLCQEKLPKSVISFYSSALISIKVLFQNIIQIIAIKLPEDLSDKDSDIVYDYFRLELSSSFSIKDYLEFI